MYIEIWMEGYRATGEEGKAQVIWRGEAENFDDAVNKYNDYCIQKYGKASAERNNRNRYISDEYYENRRSDWNIWACNLFDNEQDARKSFG